MFVCVSACAILIVNTNAVAGLRGQVPGVGALDDSFSTRSLAFFCRRPCSTVMKRWRFYEQKLKKH